MPSVTLIPALPRSTAIVRQSVAVSFLIGMSLVGFDCLGRGPRPTPLELETET